MKYQIMWINIQPCTPWGGGGISWLSAMSKFDHKRDSLQWYCSKCLTVQMWYREKSTLNCYPNQVIKYTCKYGIQLNNNYVDNID